MSNSFMNLSVMPERTFEDAQNVDVPFEREVVCKCDLCGGDIYHDDKGYKYKFNNICNREDCEKELAETLLYKYMTFFRKVEE